MKIGICDDSATDRRTIMNWIITHVPIIQAEDIVEFQNGWALLDYLTYNVLDILCLDCQMDEIDGIKTARAIRANVGDILIMLISNYHEYAHYGYELNIFRYLLKPDFPAQAPDAFRYAINHIRQSAGSMYWLKERGVLKQINISRVTHVENTAHKLTYSKRLD